MNRNTKRTLIYGTHIAATAALMLSSVFAAEEPQVVAPAADQPKAATKSADEIAKELANPNNSLASLNFKNQFRWFEGDLPNADDQFNYTLLFQPVFPFTLPDTAGGGKANLFIRPAFPIVVEQPVFNAGKADFDDASGLGDIGFDVAYGVTEKNGLLWAVGAVGSIPTGTDSRLTNGQFSLGPDLLLAKLTPKYVYGILANHQWDVAGWRDQQVNLSLVQPIFTYLPGGGWSIGTGGIMNYNWDSEQWTVPLNLQVTKTTKLGKMPIKIGLEVNYYVERPDSFASEWMVSLNITPVVPNIIDEWIHRNR